MPFTETNLAEYAADLLGEFPATSGTWDQDGTSQTISGTLHQRSETEAADFQLDPGAARLTVLETAFTTVSVPAVGDTWTVSGNRSYDVVSVSLQSGQAFYSIELARRTQRASVR